jgi:hypothetical protein
MVLTSEHKRFIIESYFRNSVFNNGEWTYSPVACLSEFNEKFQIETGICNQEYFHAFQISVGIRLKSQRFL